MIFRFRQTLSAQLGVQLTNGRARGPAGRPIRKPGFVAAVYVAVENSVTLLIGVRMGGGRMAGQDRNMLGGMKALILVKTTHHPFISIDQSHVVCLQQLF